MSQMNEIIKLIKELETELSPCTKCGMCHTVCPLFPQTGREADIARGKISLLDGINKNIFNNSSGVLSRLNRCLLCGSCKANCPRHVNTIEIFIKARMIISGYNKLPLIKRIILRGIVSKPALFNLLASKSIKYQKLLLTRTYDSNDTSFLKFGPSEFKKRRFTPLAKKPFNKQIKNLNKNIHQKADNKKIKVLYFTGCIIDKFFPRIAEKTIETLNFHDIDVVIPENQACCGIPAVSSGDSETLQKLINHNIKLFSSNDFDYILTSCSSCTYTIKKIWPMLFQSDKNSEIEKLNKISAKTLDINQFISQKIDIVRNDSYSKEKIKLTYHDPCHLSKSLKCTKEPRELLNSFTKYDFIEMDDSTTCCGMGGSFNIDYYDISLKIGKKKLENITNSKASVVATSCPACMMQLIDLISQADKKIEVKHPIEIYNEGLKS